MDNSDIWLRGLGINQADGDGEPIANGITEDNVNGPFSTTQGPMTDELPAINLPLAFANEFFTPSVPPPPPNPTFLPTPPQLAQQHQTETLEDRVEGLFREAERNQSDREQRLQDLLDIHDRRRVSEFRYLNGRLRALDNGLQVITEDIASLKRRTGHLEEQTDDIRAENREAKRRATEDHNVVRGVLMNFSRQAGDRHRAMKQRFTEVEEFSRKTERRVEKLGKAVKDAASELHKLSNVVGKNGSTGDWPCLGCLAPNFVCIHHVVSPDTVSPIPRKESGAEDSESQRTDTSSSNRTKTDISCSERPGRPLSNRSRTRPRSRQ
ncbi:hypothetical protein PISL3812_00086 [Talaromyces islandicus]|uniref:Uncharacterized protein n=1 Tax=Talaromyces islandicus TaxID=28573 RepID=A0A0U1LKV6_TALIS|nr:hypothetical protein PISL3812_00086 [Talaromyces islandicus]